MSGINHHQSHVTLYARDKEAHRQATLHLTRLKAIAITTHEDHMVVGWYRSTIDAALARQQVNLEYAATPEQWKF